VSGLKGTDRGGGTDGGSINRALARFQVVALVVGTVAGAACVLGALSDQQQFFPSYLFAYLYWAGITLGCLALVLLRYLTGSKWTAALRAPADAAARTLPLMALLFLPLVVGLPHLYPWARPDIVSADPLLQHKAPYLNVPFFLGRSAAFYLAWGGLTLVGGAWTRRAGWPAEPRLALRMRNLGGLGLVVWALTASFAFLDWLMSLEPDWVSAVYPLLVIAGSALASMAVVVLWLVLSRSKQGSASSLLDLQVLTDLGRILLALVMLWAYMAFAQYLVIWMGNLPNEVTWYLRRLDGGWQWIGGGVAVFQFALPFLLLLPPTTKRSARALAGTSALLLAVHVVEVFWLVMPVFRPSVWIHWLDLAALLATGGLWLALFLQRLKVRSPAAGSSGRD
jgi:hypothetical protein